MKRGDKRGQFYLIAAMIIILILVAFVIVSNYSQKRNYSIINELSQELEIEGGKVIDYDTYNSANYLEDFAEGFSAYAGANTEIYYIVGKEGSIEAYKFEGDQKITKDILEENKKIFINVNNIEYMFNIQLGENFYYIISQNINGAAHVVTN